MNLSMSKSMLLNSLSDHWKKQKRERFGKEYKLSENYIDIFIQNRQKGEYFEKGALLAKKHGLSYQSLASVMINQNLDAKYPEPASLVKKLLELQKKEYAGPKEVQTAIQEVLKQQKKAVADYQTGKGEVIGFLIGMVQKELKGKGDPAVIRERLLKELEK